jgi:mRNA interferase RelE/StbE
MEIKFAKAFEKDLKAVNEKVVVLKVGALINELKAATSLTEIGSIKKLKGHKDCYRIRIGNYRLGVLVEGNTVWLARIMLRKDIYKFFP